MRLMPVLPQINPLPCSEDEPAIVERDGKIHRRQCGADVRGHIIIALSSVNEQRIAIAHEPREERIEVAAHVGIGILLD